MESYILFRILLHRRTYLPETWCFDAPPLLILWVAFLTSGANPNGGGGLLLLGLETLVASSRLVEEYYARLLLLSIYKRHQDFM